MKNTLYTLALISVMLPCAVMAAEASGSGTAQVEVVSPVTITDTNPLDFGTVTNEGGSFSVNLSSDVESDTGIHVDSGRAVSAGSIRINGPSGVSVYIQFPTDPIRVSADDPDSYVEIEAIPEDDFISGMRTGSAVRTLEENGEAEVIVGGSITVPAGTAEGLYQGSYDIQATY